MPETVTATAGTTVDAPSFDALAARTPTAPSNELGKDEFLKLLVAQLKYQDPLEPTSSDEFIATSAQFTIVEKLDELTKQGANTALVNSLTTASSLIGREVTTNGEAGPVTSTVERSQISGGEVLLVTDKGSVRLDQIVSVGSGSLADPLAPPADPVTPPAVSTHPAAAAGQSATGPQTDPEVAGEIPPVTTSEQASSAAPASPPTPNAQTSTEADQVGEQ